jgi:hypothetical protein
MTENYQNNTTTKPMENKQQTPLQRLIADLKESIKVYNLVLEGSTNVLTIFETKHRVEQMKTDLQKA